MTTQVVLMNGLGIALASDSAVTAGGKVLNTSEKIFELPHPHKAAILTSGRARFMGMPWEVLLSAWSETLDKPLQSMPDYMESLFAFLRATVPNSGELDEKEVDYLESTWWGDTNVYGLLQKALREHILPLYEGILEESDLEKFRSNEWDAEFRQSMTEKLTEDAVSALLEALRTHGENRKAFVACPDVSEAQARIWLDKYWKSRGEDQSWPNVLNDWPEIPGIYEVIVSLHALYIVHADYEGESSVNIVGYGAADMFPSWFGTFLHGAVRGTLLKRFEEQVTPAAYPRDLFFGQADAISALTGRGDRLLTNVAVETQRNQLSEILEQLGGIEHESLLQTKEYIKQSLDNESIRERMLNEGQEKRRDPFRKAIGMSPILDLAEFSAQLVGVQAAYAAMTQENPSVGGFVDVGIITHRRGFEWIRHKH